MSERPLPAPWRPPPPALIERELQRAERYAAGALAPSTRRAYERDWLTFASWCAQRGLVAIPAAPATVAAFLAAEADRGFRAVTVVAARRRSPPRTAPRTIRIRATRARSPR